MEPDDWFFVLCCLMHTTVPQPQGIRCFLCNYFGSTHLSSSYYDHMLCFVVLLRDIPSFQAIANEICIASVYVYVCR